MIVTLTTDFGLRDGYVAAMKGVLLSRAPGVTLVDVSHQVSPQDVMEGAFVLRQALPYLPAGAVHLVVVDPGVGTARRAIAAEFRVGGRAHRFVGPDNGLLALVCGDAAPDRIVELDRPEAWAEGAVSATFHGRDLFAPVAARLARGAALDAVGTPIASTQPMHWPLPRYDDEGVDGWVVHIDGYGNCVTNIAAAEVAARRPGAVFKCYVGSTILHGLAPTYGSVPTGDALVVAGSSGLLEIAVRDGNAAELLSVHRGDSVNLVYEAAAGGDGAAGRTAAVSART